jgi:murein DD-endopeptidase MepM/ murein hydrolase activator NlpD
MNNIKLIFVIAITLALSLVLVMVFETQRAKIMTNPKELYQVYVEGQKVGIIKSKDALEKYIDNEQTEVKELYNVDVVYPPNNLYIKRYIGYNEQISSEEEIYEKIKENNPFTIKGYVFTIKGEEPKTINVLDEEMFKKALYNLVEAFVPKDEHQAFRDGNQSEVKTTGKKIEDLYITEMQSGLITKRVSYIPVDEYIFTDENELSRYLLFGNLEEQKRYVVKEGDTIANIAFDNKLGVGEFLLVNPQFNNPNNLLYPGQQVSVGLINPVLNVVVEEHKVVDQVKKYKTEVIYDSNMAYGTSKVKQVGSDGLERVVQKVKSVNGEITNAVIASSELLKVEVNEIVVKGTRHSSGTIIISPDGNWAWPTKTPYIITSPYGYRWGRLHDGVDISGPGHGSPIYAANFGEVHQTGYQWSLGNYIILRHENDYYTIYAHLSKIYVNLGQRVNRGNVIGTMGNTGFSTGTHLHFSVYIGVPYASSSRSFDPLLLYR